MNSPEGQRQANQQETGLPTERRIVMITPRERDILTARAQGLTVKEIGKLMHFSPSVIQNPSPSSPLTDRFNTESFIETVKQAVILGTVTAVPKISDEQMASMTPQAREILRVAYENELPEASIRKIADIMKIKPPTVKAYLTPLYHLLEVNSLVESLASYAHTIKKPAQHDTIVCIQEEDGAVTESKLRLLEDFVRIESATGNQRPDHVKHAIHVLRNGGTIDLHKNPFDITAVLTEPTQLQIKDAVSKPRTIVWPSVSRTQREQITALFPPEPTS